MSLLAHKVFGNTMADSLLIHYKADGALYVAQLDDHGKLRDSTNLLSLDELSEKHPEAHATLLIDSTLLHSARIALPGNNRQRQIKAAPYALEDQLACDIEDLHFTLGKREADNMIPVVCVNKTLLKKVLAQLSHAKIHVSAVCPDLLALPLADQQWTILLETNTAYIKISAQSGYYCERHNLPLILPALIKQSAVPPQTLLVIALADDDTNGLFSDIELPRVTQTFSHSLLNVFALHLGDARSMNLLQGELSVKRTTSLQWKIWRIAAIAAISWLVLKLLVAGLEIQMLNHINTRLTADIETEFKRIFPDAKKFSGMQSRVKSRLQQLRGGEDASQEIFIDMLADAVPSLIADGLTIRGISYRERHIDIELQANSLQILETAKSKLDAQRSIKAVLSTSVEKDKVRGRLRIEQATQNIEGKQG